MACLATDLQPQRRKLQPAWIVARGGPWAVVEGINDVIEAEEIGGN